MKCLRKCGFLLLFYPVLLFAQGEDPFQWDFDDSRRAANSGETLGLEVGFRIPPGHFLYKDKISLTLIEGEGFELGPLEFSPSVTKRDPFFGREMEVFEGGALLRAPLRIGAGVGEGERQIRLELSYQGCSSSLCYRQMRREILLPVEVRQGATGSALPARRGEWFSRGLLLSILLSFLAGLGSDFTPCVLPILPITLAFIGVRKTGATVGRNFTLSLFFGVSMALVYAAMGLAAAALGKNLGFLFQNLWFLLATSLLYFVFALSLFGFFELQMPLPVRQLLAKAGGEGHWGAILSGATIGFLAAPCVGPLIASLLLYVAREQDLPKGFLLLLSYGLGMGSLFVLVGTFYHRFAERVRGGMFTVWIKRGFAVLLLVPAGYYASIAYGHLEKREVVSSQALFWISDAREGLQRSAEEGRPVFLDFYASWCLPCVEMETTTFADPGLQRLLTGRFIPVKIDCTEETPQCREMTERYQIIGWPTFLILSPGGEKVLETVVGKSLTANQLSEILEKSLSL